MSAFSATIYDESLNGDLSDNYLAPTSIVLGEGSNLLIGQLNGGTSDLDLFTITVPAEMFLTSIRVMSYSGGVLASFMGVQPGPVLYASPFDYIRAGMGEPVMVPDINYVLFGGEDVLDNTNLMTQLVVGLPLGGQNPLPAGQYAFWLNETRAMSNYTLAFQVVPEPGAAVVLLMSAGLLLRRRVRRPE